MTAAAKFETMRRDLRGKSSNYAVMFILGWNARSLISNGQKFKRICQYIKNKTGGYMHTRNIVIKKIK